MEHNYKQIFDLAISKGYKPHITSNAYDTLKLADYRYLELCLCQKWLRDEHKIIVIAYPFLYKKLGEGQFNIPDDEPEDKLWSYVVLKDKKYILDEVDIDSPENALLLGIHEALKLI